ncbi:MAG: Holliday junction resolvase [Nanoarchaeota archaeon]|nr:Holliday junction resolvase [Nanoarchaeota archaeon]MBU4492840.1 Holliday junction resolvase [Nanoarchaeota archaeon]
MSRKSKGINAERELVHMFWETNEWSAVRVAGSGSSPFPCPDVLAGNRIRKLAIECKTVNAKSKYLTNENITQLNEFAAIFGAEPWIGVKFKSDWFFLSMDDLKKTEKGYAVSKDLAKNKGLLFEELVEK